MLHLRTDSFVPKPLTGYLIRKSRKRANPNVIPALPRVTLPG
jgi:hypothetical protein